MVEFEVLWLFVIEAHYFEVQTLQLHFLNCTNLKCSLEPYKCVSNTTHLFQGLTTFKACKSLKITDFKFSKAVGP